MNSLKLALITDVPLGEKSVLSMLVKGLGVGVSVIGKVINFHKTVPAYRNPHWH